MASFYAWYLRSPSSGGGDGNIERALAEKAGLFADTLLSALRADRAAAAKEPGYIVGLDFDPFTASQDPCTEYVVGAESVVADRVRVEVFAVCNGRRGVAPSLVAEVRRRGNVYEFANFVYDDRSDLLTVLTKLAANRATPPADSSPTA